MRLVRSFARAIDALNETIGRVAVWLMLAIVVVGSANAIFRYIDGARWLEFRLSSNAYLELQWQLFGLAFLLCGAYTLKHRGHVRVDVLYERVSPRVRNWIDLVGHVLFLLPFCVFMIWASWTPVRNSWESAWKAGYWMEWSSDASGLPMSPIKTVIPLAFVLLGLQAIAEITKVIDAMRDPAPSGPQQDNSPEEPEAEAHL